MTDHDPAFLWETEAIRSGAQRATEAALDATDLGGGEERSGNWVTLRDASRSTGIPVETLRKWARRATIPTYLTPAPGGTNIRMVDLDGIVSRAADLGRPIRSEPVPEPQPSTSETVSSSADVAPAGTMIVPIDAWNKMLNQLGNLHEAGQHLAEARERAAKAETEAKFLRERLAEIRTEPASPNPAVTSMSEPPLPPTADPEPPEKVWHYLVRRVRDRGNT